MEDEIKKVRIGVYMEKELVDRADELLDFAGARSRNEFVAEAVKFYIGYLHSRKAEELSASDIILRPHRYGT